jgi:hypothetical protein
MSPSAALIVLLCLAITAANASNCPNLQSAANFAAFAYTGLTSGGKSVITGMIGDGIFINYVPVPCIDGTGNDKMSIYTSPVRSGLHQ